MVRNKSKNSLLRVAFDLLLVVTLQPPRRIEPAIRINITARDLTFCLQKADGFASLPLSGGAPLLTPGIERPPQERPI
jgi:hypothetical protein